MVTHPRLRFRFLFLGFSHFTLSDNVHFTLSDNVRKLLNLQ